MILPKLPHNLTCYVDELFRTTQLCHDFQETNGAHSVKDFSHSDTVVVVETAFLLVAFSFGVNKLQLSCGLYLCFC